MPVGIAPSLLARTVRIYLAATDKQRRGMNMKHDIAFTVILGTVLIVILSSMGVMKLAEPGMPVVSVMEYLVRFYFA